MADYLFDTNALQGIGRQVLLNCRAQGHRLLISTISCFELVSHLDDENFRLARGNARKALVCDILDDPLAEIMIEVGCPAGVHPGRLEDRPALFALLRELEQCDSYAAFIAREVELAGARRPIDDVARRLREVFDRNRVAFVNALRVRCSAYTERHGREAAIHLAGEPFCRAAIGLADTLFEHTAQLGCPATRNELADRTVLGCGYGVARACMYIGSVGTDQEPAFDGNDYEDYLISLHLGVSNDRIFVTNDGGARAALGRTISAFEVYFSSRGGTFGCTTTVITVADFNANFAEPAR